MKILKAIGGALRRAWLWMLDKEPAQWQAIKMAMFAFLATIGVNLAADVRDDISFYVASGAAILAELQAIMTRKSVDSPKTVRGKVGQAEIRGAMKPKIE